MNNEAKQEIELSEVKRLVSDILFDFDRVCNELKLRYSIGFGTMIGAVRHKGFIPWDDDVDVIMPREDFNVLVKEGFKHFKPNYRLVSINEDIRFGAPLPKIIDTNTIVNQIGHVSEKMDIGVYIDIFILDKVPDNTKEQNRIFRKCQFWHSAWRFCGNAPTPNNSTLVKIIRSLLNKTNLSIYYAKKLMNIDKITSNYNSNLYSILIFKAYSYEKNIQKLSDYDDYIITDFEYGKVRILKRYDEYLTSIYGDYMKLPPKEKQITNHGFVAYYK